MNTRSFRFARATGPKLLAVVLLVSLFSVRAAMAQIEPVPLIVPPEPAVKPAAVQISEIDTNNNMIDDTIDQSIVTAQATLADPASSPADRADAQALLGAPIKVSFDFNRQITLAELNTFVQLGGQLIRIYQASYGWTGQIPRGRIPQVVALMTPGFAGVTGDKPVGLALHVATRTGRVRQQWALGYSGNPNITIAVVDTGISASHTDLTGRQQYWHDWTSEANANPIDFQEHGSHVAGIALGTGAASGVNPTTIRYTDADFFRFAIDGLGYGWLTEVPPPNGGSGAATFSYNASVVWGALGNSRSMGLGYGVYQDYDDSQTTANDAIFWYLTTESVDSTGAFSANASPFFSPLVDHVGPPIPGGNNRNTSLYRNFIRKKTGTAWDDGATPPNPLRRYSAATTLSALNGHNFGIGDSFNLERGVAPSCNWAGFKVFPRAGAASSIDIDNALDDLATVAAANNIKVANLSFGGGTDSTMRQKVINAVSAGVFVACSAGNAGPNGNPPNGSIGDPARAGLAMTVAAANTNQLTDYTTYGFNNGNTANNEDTIKPDILAPGGSSYHGSIMSVDSNDSDAGDYTFADQRANDYSLKQGTSMAAPFVAGSAALVIDAWQQSGHTWSFSSSTDPLFVKMLLCATATESNQGREYDPATSGPGINNPTLGRATTPKDQAEGYGMINVDAAIECLRRPPLIYLPISETLGSTRFDKRASGFNVKMTSGHAKTFQLTVPTGADYDLYLYSATPDARGNPVILGSSTSSTLGGTETITYTPGSSGTYYLVVKRVSGSGAFTLKITNPATLVDLWNDQGRWSYGYGVNNNGEATGYYEVYVPAATNNYNHPFHYVTSIIDLGYWSCSYDNLYGYAINDSGVIVGRQDYCGGQTLVRGFKWTTTGGYAGLGTLGGTWTVPLAVNNNGDIAGWAKNSSAVYRPVRWPAGSTTASDLGSLVSGDQQTHAGFAYGINRDGYVVGKAVTSTGSYHAFRTLSNQPIDPNSSDLGTLSGSDTSASMAYAINDARQIVGESQDSSGNYHAFLKAPDTGKNQGFTDLGVLSGATASSAYSINKSGMVVGASSAAFVWQSGLGIQNLNNYLPAGANWSLLSAEGINNDGVIVGYGYPPGYSYPNAHGFLLVPAP